MSEYGLGRLHSDDPRDAGFLMRAFTVGVDEAALPTSRYCYTPPGVFPMNQGASPHCVGFATRGLLYAGPVVNRGGPDAATIYREAQKRDEWEGEHYDGTSARGAMKYLQELGYISNYIWAFDVETIRRWHLIHNRPTLLGINWYDSFFTPRRDGFIEITAAARIAGGHEVLTLGWDDRRGALRCMNSWGNWSQHGRFWLAGETLERLLAEDGDCVTPIETRQP